MIIVKLQGGLGNQMFQYALGRRLSLRYQVPLKLDLSHLRPNLFNLLGVTVLRTYALRDFNIRAGFAQNRDLPFLSKIPSTRFTAGLNQINKLLNPRGKEVVREVPFSYTKNIKSILDAGDNMYLDGFWNREMYFKEIATVIRRDFSLKKRMLGRVIKSVRHIRETNSVSIHFRRKDYATNPNTRRFHGICGMDYYKKAIALILKKVKNPHFFVFSDDPEWVKNNFKIARPTTYVSDICKLNNAEELVLMSNCEHNIIANSSFSWWGAWLNKNPKKIVIAPKKWFRVKMNDREIIPPSWIRL